MRGRLAEKGGEEEKRKKRRKKRPYLYTVSVFCQIFCVIISLKESDDQNQKDHLVCVVLCLNLEVTIHFLCV